MRYEIIPHKDGMTWKTKYNHADTIEQLKQNIDSLTRRGFTYITIQVKNGENE